MVIKVEVKKPGRGGYNRHNQPDILATPPSVGYGSSDNAFDKMSNLDVSQVMESIDLKPLHALTCNVYIWRF